MKSRPKGDVEWPPNFKYTLNPKPKSGCAKKVTGVQGRDFKL